MVKVLVWLFGWLRIKEGFVNQAPEYIEIKLKENGVASGSIPRREALLSLAQEAYGRAKNKKGAVRWKRYLFCLDSVAEEARKYSRRHFVRDKRVREILEFYSKD